MEMNKEWKGGEDVKGKRLKILKVVEEGRIGRKQVPHVAGSSGGGDGELR